MQPHPPPLPKLLLFLGILRGVLLVVSTVAEPIVAVGDSTVVERSVLPEHIVAMEDPSASDYIAAVVRTVAVA